MGNIDMMIFAKELYGMYFLGTDKDNPDLLGKLAEMREFIRTSSDEELADALSQAVQWHSKGECEIHKVVLLCVLNEYGRRKKEAGARGYAKLVGQMRQAQRDYFRTRDKNTLARSKKLEEQVDRANRIILK